MTADRSEACTAGPDDDRPGLASAFGDSAAGSLRGLLAPRWSPVRVVPPADDERTSEPVPANGPDGPDGPGGPDTTAPTAEGTPVPERRPRIARADRPGPGTPSRAVGRRAPTTTGAAPRRRSVRVRDRQSIDLMLLAVARDGAAGGRRFAELVRERSGGAVELDERTLYSELHRLRDKRLIADTGRGSERRYVLTEIGERVLDSRIRGWQAFAGAMDRVLTSDDR